MDKVVDKFHALQLFTDTFAAETVHLTNEAIGIYIRLLCFNWTKNTKPFQQKEAYRICQCRSEECEAIVDLVLKEFFMLNSTGYTHKRLVKEYNYLTAKYKKKSEAGKLGMEIRYGSVNNKSLTPIPRPRPNNIYIDDFNKFWNLIRIKKGSKKLAQQKFIKECEGQSPEEIAEAFNRYSAEVKDKQFVAHVATWLSQRRFEDEANNKPQEIIIPPVIYNDEVLKKRGEFGHFEEYEDSKGNKYHKHKFKPNAKVEPVN
tara:strand:+ start:58 stop:834 length:777 start_codon:yes stop_codon:yes gene_type:complete